MKRFEFVNKAARDEYLELPQRVRRIFGFDLHAIQRGLKPESPSVNLAENVGKGAFELKVNGSPAFRVVYCARYGNTVFILHSFAKTTNSVDRKAMDTARRRYLLMLELFSQGEN